MVILFGVKNATIREFFFIVYVYDIAYDLPICMKTISYDDQGVMNEIMALSRNVIFQYVSY